MKVKQKIIINKRTYAPIKEKNTEFRELLRLESCQLRGVD